MFLSRFLKLGSCDFSPGAAKGRAPRCSLLCVRSPGGGDRRVLSPAQGLGTATAVSTGFGFSGPNLQRRGQELIFVKQLRRVQTRGLGCARQSVP